MDASRNTLGRCEQCKGKLMTKGAKICCGQCGLPVLNHPLAAKLFPPAKVAAPHAVQSHPQPVEPVAAFTVGRAVATLETPEESRRQRGSGRQGR